MWGRGGLGEGACGLVQGFGVDLNFVFLWPVPLVFRSDRDGWRAASVTTFWKAGPLGGKKIAVYVLYFKKKKQSSTSRSYHLPMFK